MNYSVTIIGIVVAVIGRLGQAAGVHTDSVTVENLTEVVTVAMQIIGVLTAWYGRIRKGDVSIVGYKMPQQ